jgi:hypothetical protein
MKKLVIAMAMSLCVVSLAALASADTLVMRDGTRRRHTNRLCRGDHHLPAG